MLWPFQNPVLVVLCSALWLGRCDTLGDAEAASAAPQEVAPGVFLLGRITDPRLTECSGVVRSSTDTNIFWVHNDGPRPRLFGIKRTGEVVAEFPVMGAILSDWEDIASDGHGNLFLGDLGNNDLRRRQITVYQIKEPTPADSGKPVQITRTFHLRFARKPFDCEALFIWKDHGYLVSKVFDDAKAGLYRFPLSAEEPVTLEFVTDLDITTPVTGADISPHGTRLGLVGHSGAFVLRINGDPSIAGKAREDRIRFKDERIEGCCFVEEGLMGVSENREIYLFRGKGFRPK
jgi:hypothetical protein